VTRLVATWLLAGALGATAPATASPAVVWRDNDDQPIAEPADDDEGDYIWWDGVYNMAVGPLADVLDLGDWSRLLGPPEAANVNALDEVPDSTWFTNRHARRRLGAAALERGAPPASPPADGPLVVVSGKSLGMTPGFVVRDRRGDRFIVKFDPPEYPDLATGAELVCARIVWALGWNVPDDQLFLFRPEALAIAPDAWAKDEYNRKVPMTPRILERELERAYRLPDGRIRALASRLVSGTTKGSPKMIGTRPDDPNDTVRHEDRRDLRGLRVVAAFLNYTDARRGNLLDSFVRDGPGRDAPGHLVHYVLDFSSALGSGNVDWKDPKLGNEYLFDPRKVLPRLLTLGFVEPAWARLPLTHPALGYFESSLFDPDDWRTSYRNPIFDRATVRDRFWAAKLVASLREADLRAAARAGAWSDPRVDDLLVEILAERQRRIARAYFDPWRINPIDRFETDGVTLRFADMAVDAGVADRSAVRHRYRPPRGEWTVVAEPRVPLGPSDSVVEIETSHDAGRHWSPSTVVRIAREGGAAQVVGIERATR
jgi:hypothetical protein